MQADPELRQSAGEADRIIECWRPDHEARGRKDAFQMGALDGSIDLGREAEIISRDDEALGHGFLLGQIAVAQLASWRDLQQAALADHG